ncbi:MAG TPA: MFS transporter [Propionibacterium sp.]|nr:MFS transporter [Propionibacterium sp.]
MRTTPTGPDLRPLAVGMLAGVFAAAFEGIAVATAMPAAAQDLGQIELYAWAFSLYMVGMLTGAVASGRLADRRGPLPPLAVALVIFVVGLLIAGFAPTMAWLLIGRLIQGLGAGGLNVGLYFVVAHAFPEKTRPLMMTLFSACWILPAFVGPPVAAWVTKTWSWHWVFLGIVPLMFLAAVLILPPLLRLQSTHRIREGANPVPAWIGLVLSGGAVLVQYAGQRFADHRDWGTALVVGAVGLALLAFGLPRLMPPGFIRFGHGLPSVMLTRALVAGSFFGAEAFIPLMLVELHGQSLTRAGMMLTIGSVGWFVGSWLQSRPWFRVERHVMIVLGAISVMIGIAGTALVAWLPGLWVGVAWIIWPLAGFGMGLVVASTGLAQMAFSPPSQQGRNASAITSGESLGNSVVTGLAGTIFAALHFTAPAVVGFGAALTAMIAVACIGVVAAARIGPVRSSPVEA